METIQIKKESEQKDNFIFSVTINEEKSKTQHSVTLDKKYWEKLTQRNEEPEELIKRSFVFLLEREPKESIFHEFNLSVIQNYFQNYEQEIKK